MHFTIFFVALLSSSLVSGGPLQDITKRAVSPDMTCGLSGTGGSAEGYSCPSTAPCCSVHGFCGSTDAYCLTTTDCQPAYGNCTEPVPGTISPDETCGVSGAGTAGYTCPDPQCCSMNGWCGITSNYCDQGCQSEFGICSNDTTGGGGGGSNSNNMCGPGIGSCAADECCSFAGFCGTTEDYCMAPDCQFDYGPACDSNKVPSGTNTSSIPRPMLGGVLYGSDGIYDCLNAGDVALTFDDGPYIYTSHILDLLDQYEAKATFFVTGNNNGKGEIDNTSFPWAAVIKRAYDSNHQIASHTWSHLDLCNITSLQRKNEMWKNEMALRNILGVIPTYMRPPYSDCTAECGCEADLLELGYHITYFDVDTQDYLNDSPTLIVNSENFFDAAFAGASPATDDFLVIAHDIHNQTSQVLVEYMLMQLKAQGYNPVTVGECLGDPMENWYRTDTGVALGN